MDKGLDLWEPSRAMCSCHTVMCRRMWYSGLGRSPKYSLQMDMPDCASVGLLYKACVCGFFFYYYYYKKKKLLHCLPPEVVDWVSVVHASCLNSNLSLLSSAILSSTPHKLLMHWPIT